MDLFYPGRPEISVTFSLADLFADREIYLGIPYDLNPPTGNQLAAYIQRISAADQDLADIQALVSRNFALSLIGTIPLSGTLIKNWQIILTAPAYLYVYLLKTGHLTTLTSGGAYIGDVSATNSGKTFSVYRITNPNAPPDTTQPPPGTTPPPATTPGPVPGPQIIECVFPALQWNLIQVLSDLVQWIGCILHNIITILNWFVDWILHFPDHLDAWISRLFGVDPALPFFDEVMKKIDIWISNKFGVDPEKPLWEELVKKAIGWLSDDLDEAARKATERLK